MTPSAADREAAQMLTRISPEEIAKLERSAISVLNEPNGPGPAMLALIADYRELEQRLAAVEQERILVQAVLTDDEIPSQERLRASLMAQDAARLRQQVQRLQKFVEKVAKDTDGNLLHGGVYYTELAEEAQALLQVTP